MVGSLRCASRCFLGLRPVCSPPRFPPLLARKRRCSCPDDSKREVDDMAIPKVNVSFKIYDEHPCRVYSPHDVLVHKRLIQKKVATV